MAAQGFRVAIFYATGQWDAAQKVKHESIARAVTLAMHETALETKQAMRANIMGAGFSYRWANSLRVESYPKRGKNSIDAAVQIWHKIPYAGVFETGATIRGKPLMWIPTSYAAKTLGLPALKGRFRLTPVTFAEKYGRNKLVPFKSRRGTPLLGVKISVGRGNVRSALKLSSAQIAKSRALPGGSRRVQTIPIFAGVKTVTIKKRFNLTAIKEAAEARVPEKILAFLKDD